MSHQNRTTLKSYFNTGARPTQEQFADLIDSSLNLVDNGIFDEGGNLGLGHSNPSSRLSVKGSVTVSPNNDSAPGNGLFVHGNVGIGAGFTNPTAQLAVKGGVYIGDTQNTDPGVNSLQVDGNVTTGGDLSVTGNLTLQDNGYVATDEVRARDSSGLKLHEDGGKGLLVHDSSGDVSAGGNLTVTGSIQATSLSLTGGIQETEFKGHHEAGTGVNNDGDEYATYQIEVPDGKVVVGLVAKKYLQPKDDKELYSFALMYR